jgi:hypothetical protein
MQGCLLILRTFWEYWSSLRSAKAEDGRRAIQGIACWIDYGLFLSRFPTHMRRWLEHKAFWYVFIIPTIPLIHKWSRMNGASFTKVIHLCIWPLHYDWIIVRHSVLYFRHSALDLTLEVVELTDLTVEKYGRPGILVGLLDLVFD